MNKYVIRVHNEYDMYSVDEFLPFETIDSIATVTSNLIDIVNNHISLASKKRSVY